MFENGLGALGIDRGLVITANVKASAFAGPWIAEDQPGVNWGDASIEFRQAWGVNSDPSVVSGGDQALRDELPDGSAFDLFNTTSVEFTVVPTERYLKFEYVLGIADGAFFNTDPDDSFFKDLGWTDAGGGLSFPDAFGLFVTDSNEVSRNYSFLPGSGDQKLLTLADSGIATPPSETSPPMPIENQSRLGLVEAFRAVAEKNYSDFLDPDKNTAEDEAQGIFYFVGDTEFPDLLYFDTIFCPNADLNDPDNKFCDDVPVRRVDWSINFLSVPITVVHDTGLTSFEDAEPITVRIVIADVGDVNVPPALFLAADSVRFEDNDSIVRTERVRAITAPQSLRIDEPRERVVVQLRDSVGSPVLATAPLAIGLSSFNAGGLTFFDASTAGAAINQVVIGAGESNAEFWVGPGIAGSQTLILSPSRSDLSNSEISITVFASAQALIGLLSDPDNLPDVPTYEGAGINEVDIDNFNDINNILISLGDDVPNTGAGIQDVVDAYIKITSGGPGTQAEFERIGLGFLDTDAKANLMNSVLAAKDPGDIDSIAKVTALATIVEKVITLADEAADPTPTVTSAEFLAIGVAGVSDNNLIAVLAQIKATNPNGTGVDSLAKLDALVIAANAAVEAVINPPEGTTLDEDDYEGIGVNGVTEDNVEDINEILKGLGNNAPTSPGGIQDVVDAYVVITTGKGPDGKDADPKAADYAAIGVNGVTEGNEDDINSIRAALGDDAPTSPAEIQALVDTYLKVVGGGPATGEEFEQIGLGFLDTPAKVNLMNSVLAAKAAAAAADIDSLEKVTELAAIVSSVIRLASRPTGILPREFTLIGVVGVTADNLSALSIAILDTPSDGSSVDSLAKLQGLVNAIEGDVDQDAVAILVNYDPDSPTAPSVKTYEDAGIVGVDGDNLDDINDYLSKVGADKTLTPAEIQTLVNAYNRIALAADGDPTTPADLSAEQYQALGLPEFELEAAVTLMNSVLGGLNKVPSFDELQGLAESVVRILAVSSGEIDAELSEADFELIGVTGITDEDDFDTVIEAISGTPEDGTGIDTVGKIQALVNAVLSDDEAFAAELASLLDAASPSVKDFDDAGIYGVTTDNLVVVRGFIDELKDTAGEEGLSRGATQAAVNASNLILAAGNNKDITDAGLTAAQYQALGFDGVDSDEAVAVLNQLLAEESLTVEFETADDIRGLVNTVTQLFGVASDDADGLTAQQWIALEGLLAGARPSTFGLLNTVVAKLGPSGIADLDTIRDVAGTAAIITFTANGNSSSRPNLDAARYQTFGLTGVSNARQALFLNQVLGGLTETAVDSASKLDAVADAALRILAAADGDSAADTVSAVDFALIGITGVQPGSVPGVLAQLGEADIEAAGFDLQALVDEFEQFEAVPVPTLSWWALMLMMLLMLSIGLRRQTGARR